MPKITVKEGMKHLRAYRRATGATQTQIIEKLVEGLIEDGQGLTLLGTFEVPEEVTKPATKKHNVRVRPETRYVGMGKQHSLDPTISVADIDAAVGKASRSRGRSGDGKVQFEWQFTADGYDCGIWDYYGARWSAYGPAEIFRKLGLPLEGDFLHS